MPKIYKQQGFKMSLKKDKLGTAVAQLSSISSLLDAINTTHTTMVEPPQTADGLYIISQKVREVEDLIVSVFETTDNES